MSTLTLKTHTVILYVGPTGCGKTYFSKNYLIPQLNEAYQKHLPKWKKPNIQYIGSDECRQTLLNDPECTYDTFTDRQKMMEVSEHAFELLYIRLQLAMSYPVNSEIIIVDTTGLNDVFRAKIATLVKQHHYNLACVLFAYNKRDEYFKYIKYPDMKLINNHINRLHTRTLSELKRNTFTSFLHIKEKEFTEIKVDIPDLEHYASHFLPLDGEYCVIGDIHGNYDLLIQLLERHDFKIQDGIIAQRGNKLPIILGDYIDGCVPDAQIVKTVWFLYENRHHFKFVLGNHEHFVYQFYKGNINKNSLPTPEFINQFFPTTRLLEVSNVGEMLSTLVEECTKNFYIGSNFIATHAPCSEKYLGKLDSYSLRKMCNFFYPRQGDQAIEDYSSILEESLLFLKEEASKIKPFHFFGHVSFDSPLAYKNKHGVDTGVSSGGKLTSVSIVGSRLYYYSVGEASTKPLPKQLFKRKARQIDLDQLESKEQRRLSATVRDKIMYISGTMAPANSDIEKGQLESIEKAFEYFKQVGVTSICLQPKYMGSRAELFLDCKDPANSYTSTRKGYPVRIDLSEAYEEIHTRLTPYITQEKLDWILLDTELMPWHTLGRGLIHSQYNLVKEGIESEIRLLQETGFEDKLKQLQDEILESDYRKLVSQVSKKNLKEIIPSHKIASYQALLDFDWIPLSEQEKYFANYKRQLELYASEGRVHFKPFSILKSSSLGKEKLYFEYTNEQLFKIVSEDPCLVLDLEDADALDKAETFFADEILAKDLEGMVIKPQAVNVKDVAPYLKVRNPKYLAIIYGYDYFYKPKYDKLVKGKNTKRKLRSSIVEYNLGKQMLEIPYTEISEKNEEYINIVAQLILEEKKEQYFDPRL